MTLRHCLLLSALAACPDPDPEPKPEPVREHVLTITPNLDLLFVIDDSGSMADKQNAFNRAFPALVNELALGEGGLPNLHLGVTSTDLGTSAAGTTTPEPGPGVGTIGQGGCAAFGKNGDLTVNGAAVTGTFVQLGRDGSRNFTGTLDATFSQMAALGARGCGFEQQLGAMRKALDGHNAGFVRPSANLGVIVLSDEDDCSAANPSLYAQNTELGNLDSFRCFRFGVECVEDTGTVGVKTQCAPRASSAYVADVAPFRDFLLGLKQNEARRVMFGSLIGDPTKVEVELRTPPGGTSPNPALKHSCDYTTVIGPAVADPGVRFAALAKSFPGPTKSLSICSDDLAPQAKELGTALRGLVNDTCLAAPLAATADCIVVDHRDSDATYSLELPACGARITDCFELVDDSRCAGAQRVEIVRSATATHDTWSTLRCAI